MARHATPLWPAFMMVAIMLIGPWISLVDTPTDGQVLMEENTTQNIDEQRVSFTTNDGFVFSNLTTSSTTGITTLERPQINWIAPTTSSLTTPRTAGCTAYLPSTDEVLYAGGRVDPNPLQNGDDAPSKMVEIFSVGNQTWSPSANDMVETQQFHGCATVNNKIYAVGDYHPYASPEIQSSGLVQVYNPTNQNWSYGTSMPSNKGVGLAGVEGHNDMIYVAGGVSKKDRSDITDRLMQYDVANDTWSEWASMHNPRHSFDLVAYQGKLIAFGGVVRYFDPIENTTVTREANLTEAYDPITDTWTNLTNSSKKFSAYAATVFNEEIIIHGGYYQSGWQATLSDKTYGYNPFTNEWRTHATFQYSFYDSSIVTADDALVFAGGESSTTRFSTWSLFYTEESGYFNNPDVRSGWMTSPAYSLMNQTEGSASPVWLNFQANTPSGTTAELQFRSAETSQGIATAPWKPTTVPVFTYYQPSNISLTEINEDTPYLQYRVRFSTIHLMDWITPYVTQLTLGSEEASFMTTPPTTMQPTAEAMNITTFHQGHAGENEFQLSLHSVDELGLLDPGSEWATLKWNTSTETFAITDTSGLLFPGQVQAVAGNITDQGQQITWSFSLSGTLPTDYMKVKTSTHGVRNTTYHHPEIINIDKEVLVEITNITADFSSLNDDTLEAGEVIPANTVLNVSIDHSFANSGLRLLGGIIQARLHMDVRTEDLNTQNQPIWENQSSQWFNLPSGQLYHAEYITPESISGETHFWFEARTSEDWDLEYSTEPHVFILNGDAPILIARSPDMGAYINQDPYRLVNFEFHDVGGFTTETLTAWSWIEARDDGTNEGTLDGIPQRSEYQQSLVYLNNHENVWFVNVTVNDTINDDHQWNSVLLEGHDLAGYPIPAALAEDGHAKWETREPSNTVLETMNQLGNLISLNTSRIEPSKQIGFEIVAYDANSEEDITEVRIELGGDSQLGLTYTPLEDTCAALDSRLIIDTPKCDAEFVDGKLVLSMWATVDWTFAPGGLVAGELDVILTDYDGAVRMSYENAWSLERDLGIEIISVLDNEGPVQQPITSNATLIAGEHLNLTATVTHLVSDTTYNGMLRLQWDGKIQNDAWRGGVALEVVDGVLKYAIPTPIQTGLVNDVELSLWDPLQISKLATLDLPDFMIDSTPPELLVSNLASSVSRYHLEAVEIGVNIDEAQGWSSPLTLTCQIRSLESRWEAVTITRNSTTFFDGKTMFSFTYDFSGLGDPSTLSSQATIACWAQGADDAGWDLYSTLGNTELNPWLEATLNNIGPDLKLENIEFEGEFIAGESISISAKVVNAGESLPTPFNVSIELVQGEVRTLVGRSIFYYMDQNTAESIKRSIVVPEGDFTLEITVDKEGLIWELDETNNIWSKEFNGESQGLGAIAITMISFSCLALLGSAVLLKRRGAPEVDEEKVIAAINETTNVPEVAQTPPAQPVKRRGPPGAKVSSSSGQKPSNGPPRGPPKAAEETSPKDIAAQYLEALGPATPIIEQSAERVDDYSQLPGGGEYEYTPEATFYVGESCGRWILNEDKSFSKVDDNETSTS